MTTEDHANVLVIPPVLFGAGLAARTARTRRWL
jgi:hypothetical protein